LRRLRRLAFDVENLDREAALTILAASAELYAATIAQSELRPAVLIMEQLTKPTPI
jgi:hypothetical protein